MNYFKTIWFNDFQDEPVLIYSETDDLCNETRKIEFYRNGKIGFADIKTEFNGSMLSIEPIPKLQEINNDKEFYMIKITQDEFEIIWKDSFKIIKK